MILESRLAEMHPHLQYEFDDFIDSDYNLGRIPGSVLAVKTKK